MNTKNNQRFQETEEKIFSIYLQLLKEKKKRITVQEICGRGGFNRSTFYLHFVDVPDLEEKAVDRLLIRKMQRVIKEKMNLAEQQDSASKAESCSPEQDNRRVLMREYMLSMLQYMEEHQEEYRLLWASYEGNYMERHTEELFRKIMIPYLETYGIKDRGFMQYLFHFFHAGYFSVVKIWLINGCRETPEEITDIVFKCMPSPGTG